MIWRVYYIFQEQNGNLCTFGNKKQRQIWIKKDGGILWDLRKATYNRAKKRKFCHARREISSDLYAYKKHFADLLWVKCINSCINKLLTIQISKITLQMLEKIWAKWYKGIDVFLITAFLQEISQHFRSDDRSCTWMIIIYLNDRGCTAVVTVQPFIDYRRSVYPWWKEPISVNDNQNI